MSMSDTGGKSTSTSASTSSSGDSNSKTVALVSKHKVSIPISIVLETLVQLVCSNHETDGSNNNLYYNEICKRLQTLGFVNESWHMDEFETLRDQLRKWIYTLMKKISSPTNQLCFKNEHYINENYSLYMREFEEIKLIGDGGFSKVYQVRHKLDGTEYAIKRIPIRSNRIESVKKYLSEAKTFSTLNHTNIVHYKMAWLEFDWSSRGVTYKRLNSHESTTEDTSDSSSNISCNVKPKKSTNKWATLCIQMNLCDSTLTHFLENRNGTSDPKTAIVHTNIPSLRIDSNRDIITQITKGLKYIHLKGIVHHDVKPGNILIQLQNNEILAQLGDFGLACPQQSDGHGEGFGTRPYAAPEQLNGKCNTKSDMYSLGVVLLELVGNFHTKSELIAVLKKFSTPFDDSLYPEFAKIISNLVNRNPDQRPDASMLLQELKSSKKDEQIAHLKTELAKRDAENFHLKELLKAHGIPYKNIEMETPSCSSDNHIGLPDQNIV